MTCRSPRNVIVFNRDAPFVAHCESLRIGRESGQWPLSDSVEACLYVSLRCGKERDRKGT